MTGGPLPHATVPDARMAPDVRIRAFAAGDEPALVRVFRSSVRGLASADYSPEQIEAWCPAAPGPADLDEWAARVRRNRPWVAVVDGEPVGYADVDASGYIDQFFVAAGFAGRGVGATLMRHVVRQARTLGATALSAHVSLTAQPFFRRAGFELIEERRPVVRGVQLRNALMRKRFGAEPAAS